MIFSSKTTLIDSVIEILGEQDVGLRGPQILLEIRKKKPAITKQGLYAAMRHLIQDGIIVRLRGIFTLSSIWKQRVVQMLTKCGNDFFSESLFAMEQGECMSYNFKNFTNCDLYWSHLDGVLIEYARKYGTPIHFYNPHNWFSIIKENTEKTLLDMIASKKIPLYITIGNLTPMDLFFQRTWNTSACSIGYNHDIGSQNTKYYNIFGDFVIEVTITHKIGDTIDIWYQTNPTLNEKSHTSLQKIINSLSPVHLKITRSKKKAELLHKKFMKIF